MISHTELQRLLNYDPTTGIFTWKVSRSLTAKVGARAGNLSGGGNWQLQISGKTYAASRLAIFYVTGEWPKRRVGHINLNPIDDRYENLEENGRIKSAGPITVDDLRSLLSYDADSGLFTWTGVIPGSRSFAGRAAGFLHHEGYIRIKIAGQEYAAHRLAWLYYYGEWPVEQIDHIDLNKTNNAIVNLREASNGQNSANKTSYTDRLKGVIFTPGNATNPWAAQIRHNKKLYYLGRFKTEREAHEAYCEKARELHGEFFNPG